MTTESLATARALRTKDNTAWSVPDMLRHVADEVESGELQESDELSAVLLLYRQVDGEVWQSSHRVNADTERRVYMLHCALTSESEAV